MDDWAAGGNCIPEQRYFISKNGTEVYFTVGPDASDEVTRILELRFYCGERPASYGIVNLAIRLLSYLPTRSSKCRHVLPGVTAAVRPFCAGLKVPQTFWRYIDPGASESEVINQFIARTPSTPSRVSIGDKR